MSEQIVLLNGRAVLKSVRDAYDYGFLLATTDKNPYCATKQPRQFEAWQQGYSARG